MSLEFQYTKIHRGGFMLRWTQERQLELYCWVRLLESLFVGGSRASYVIFTFCKSQHLVRLGPLVWRRTKGQRTYLLKTLVNSVKTNPKIMNFVFRRTKYFYQRHFHFILSYIFSSSCHRDCTTLRLSLRTPLRMKTGSFLFPIENLLTMRVP